MSRITSWPADKWLEWSQELHTLEDMSDSVVVGVGVVLNIVYLAACTRTNDGVFNKAYTNSNIIMIICIFISLLISIVLFTSTRDYSFFHNDQDPGTPNGKRLQVGQESFYKLKIWNPSRWALLLFCLFSPLHLILLQSSPYSVVPLSAQLYYVVYKYTGQQKDYAILSAQVLEEYNKKVVNPLVSVSKQDVATSTNAEDLQAKSLRHSYLPSTASPLKRPPSARDDFFRKALDDVPHTPFMSRSLYKSLYSKELQGGRDFPTSPVKSPKKQIG